MKCQLTDLLSANYTKYTPISLLNCGNYRLFPTHLKNEKLIFMNKNFWTFFFFVFFFSKNLSFKIVLSGQVGIL